MRPIAFIVAVIILLGTLVFIQKTQLFAPARVIPTPSVMLVPTVYPTVTPTPTSTATQPSTNTINMYLANNCAVQAYRSYMNGVTQLISQGNYSQDVAQRAYAIYVNGRNGCYTELRIDPNTSTLQLEPMYPPTN